MAGSDTIKDALADIGQAVQQPGMEQAVQKAMAAGRQYEIRAVFTPGKNGAVAVMHGHDAGKQQRFVRRTGLK